MRTIRHDGKEWTVQPVGPANRADVPADELPTDFGLRFQGTDGRTAYAPTDRPLDIENAPEGELLESLRHALDED